VTPDIDAAIRDALPHRERERTRCLLELAECSCAGSWLLLLEGT
jgi:hypothetical protein